ncbi:SDR family NAD(P)-dependent oxidoreductase [Brevibacillus sp. NPDC058079]|uniref:SDR family NAD(P)-dependent oxidoreductase n=1 Tax=Brevibacillus sp. NPDC058079 TaxID=3346330 RepID=UPI0036E3D88D
MKLKNKVALVTGGATGIGQTIVEGICREGGKVVVASRNERHGNSYTKSLRDKGYEVLFVQTDVSDYKQVERAVDFTVESFGRIDIMINNAGMILTKPLLEIDPVEDYYPTVNVNQYGVMHGILAASKKMKELGIQGVILNTSSVLGEFAGRNVMAYAATKAAVLMMTKSAALELAPYGIRVVAIQPGGVDTDLLGDLHGGNDAYKQFIANAHLRKTLIPAAHIGSAVAFLVSDDAYAINGTTVKLDDGFTISK